MIRPYLNAELFNSMAGQQPMRWAITFGDREREEAAVFEEAFELVTERVKPHRAGLTRQVHESRYWLYWDKRQKFFESIAGKARVLVCPIVTKHLSFRFFSTEWVFSHRVKVFDVQSEAIFAVLQSSIHEAWARATSSTLGQTMNYSTSDSFDSFAFPQEARWSDINAIGATYANVREKCQEQRCLGLTGLYNLLHDARETSGDIALRSCTRS